MTKKGETAISRQFLARRGLFLSTERLGEALQISEEKALGLEKVASQIRPLESGDR
jgi:hypothetical protein